MIENDIGQSRKAGTHRLAGIACTAGFVGMAVTPIVQDIRGIGWTAMARRAQGPEVAWLATTPLADLTVFDAGPAPSPAEAPRVRYINDVYRLQIFGDGVSLLRERLGDRKDARVLPLAFSNPFPALLGLPPVRHELAWWHYDRTFSKEITPDGEQLMGGVDYLLLPKLFRDLTTRMFRQNYARQIARDFRQVDENRSWVLLARRDCGRRGLC